LTWHEELQLERPSAPRVLSSLLSLEETDVAQGSAVRNAWLQLELDGVLCFDRQASVYFKQVREYNPAAERRLHQKLWSHGVAPVMLVRDQTQYRVYSAYSPLRQVQGTKPSFVESLERVRDSIRLSNLAAR